MDREVPTRAEVLDYFDQLSNRGRWGSADELGTLNLITDRHRVEAARSVSHGTVVSLGMDLDAEDPDPLKRGTELTIEPTTYSMGRMFSARERVVLTPHGSLTHL